MAGGSSTFSVTASGTGSQTYQWRKDGVNIAGATNSTYVIGNVQPAHAGAYSVSVRDSSGSTDSSNAVLTVTGPYIFSTLAGSPRSGRANGVGSAARFNFPPGVAADSLGNVYVADAFNSTIRKLTPDGGVSTWAGSAGNVGNADGSRLSARFYFPLGVAVDTNGYLYVTDNENNTVRKGWRFAIITQPQSATVFPGANMEFRVEAIGQPPLAYQWQFQGTNLDGATNSVLLLTNVTTNQSGSYSAAVTSAGVTVASADAVLVADTTPDKTPLPSLRVGLSGNDLLLSWPTNAAGFVVETSESLAQASWTPASLTPEVIGDRYSAKTSISVGRQFYRLRKE